MKMRTKEEILKDLNDPHQRRSRTRQTFFEDCQLEVLFDIRDLLNDLLCEIRDFVNRDNSS